MAVVLVVVGIAVALSLSGWFTLLRDAARSARTTTGTVAPPPAPGPAELVRESVSL